MSSDSPNLYEEAEAMLTDWLRVHGLRKTPERFAILKQTLAMPSHFAIHDLLAEMERIGYHVSRGTVYNTVEILCRCGMLQRHLLDNETARYEVRSASHIHLICTQCGKIREVSRPELSRMLMATDFPDFRASYFSASLYGLCSACQHKEKRD